MAQLRDAQTSELLVEGTPLEVALAARSIGSHEVIFDDVGGDNFDPAAVIAAHESTLEGLERASADAKGEQAETLSNALEEASGVEQRVESSIVPEATAALEDARARVGE